jgi:signal transduction histidine kinase
VTWPLPALLVSALLLLVDAVAGGALAGSPEAVLVLAALSAAAGMQAARLPLLVVTTASVAAVVVADRSVAAGRFSAANDSVFYGVVVFGPAVVGWLFGERSRRGALLRRQTTELERRRLAAALAARAGEAERIERQVDGALAQRLLLIAEGVQAAAGLVGDNAAGVPDRLFEVEATARAALEDLRAVLGTIRVESTPAGPGPSQPAQPRPLPRWVDLLLCLAGIPLAVETGRPWVNLVLAAMQGPAVCLVWRRPLAGTVPVVLLAVGQTAFLAPLPPTVSWLLLGVLLVFLSSFRLHRSRVPLGLLVLAVEFAAVTLATPSPARSLSGLIPSSVLAAVAFGAGRLVRGAELQAVQLQATLEELERTRDESAALAAADQRATIARELHDVGAHTLTVVCLQAAAVQALWERDPAQAREALMGMLALADGALSHLTASLTGLASQPSNQPLDPPALQVLAHAGRALGLAIAIETTGVVRPVEDQLAQAAFRVVQESLTNAARHAAGARVRISLDYSAEELILRILDFGPSNEAAASPLTGSGIGLQGMRERVQAVGGTLEAGPLDTGFAVEARLPLQPRRAPQRRAARTRFQQRVVA